MTTKTIGKCGQCNSDVKRYHTMWKNQHGYCERYFCRVCGAMTDYTVINSKTGFGMKVHPMKPGDRPIWWQPTYAEYRKENDLPKLLASLDKLRIKLNDVNVGIIKLTDDEFQTLTDQYKATQQLIIEIENA